MMSEKRVYWAGGEERAGEGRIVIQQYSGNCAELRTNMSTEEKKSKRKNDVWNSFCCDDVTDIKSVEDLEDIPSEAGLLCVKWLVTAGTTNNSEHNENRERQESG